MWKKGYSITHVDVCICSFTFVNIHPYMHQFHIQLHMNSIIHTFNLSYICTYVSVMNTFSCTYIQLYIHSGMHTFSNAYIRLFIHSAIQSFSYSAIHTISYTYIQQYIHSVTHTFSIHTFTNTYIQ